MLFSKSPLSTRLRAGALALLVAVFSAPPLASALPSVKIGTVVWIGYGPFYVADQLDLFKKYGLKVTLQMFTDPALIPPAIASGALDGGMLTYDQVVGQNAKGQGQKVVMPIDYSNGADAIVSDSSITTIAELKGKQVAFNPLSPSDFLLSYALSRQNLMEKDVRPVNMTPEAIPAAMVGGRVKVGVTYEPNVSQILSQGGGKKFHTIFTSRNAPGLISDVLVFDQKHIPAHGADIKALIQGYLDGMDYMKKHPDDAARIIGKVMGVSDKDVKAQLDGVYNIPGSEMHKAFEKSTDTTSYSASGAVIGGILKAKGQITRIPAFEETFDDQFVKAVVK